MKAAIVTDQAVPDQILTEFWFSIIKQYLISGYRISLKMYLDDQPLLPFRSPVSPRHQYNIRKTMDITFCLEAKQ